MVIVALVWRLPSTLEAASSSPQLSASFPADVDPKSPDLPAAMDMFSWQSFVAASWPTGGAKIGQNGDNVTPWEQSWMNDFQVLVSSGTPVAWGTRADYPAGCESAPQSPPARTRVLEWTTKGLDRIGGAGSGQHATTPGSGPLIDQNGNYVRFEILFNEDMYDFIVTNKLYSRGGQKAYQPGQPVSFPSSAFGSAAEGAIMLKASWKIIGPGDNPKLFHTANAFVKDATAKNGCRYVQAGLVGLHISRKTSNFGKWIWATFEHVANAPASTDAPKGPYIFNNGQPGTDPSTWNLVPDQPWVPNVGNKTPVQVVRMIPVTPSAAPVNQTFQALLKAINQNSVFANYMLVGTQYPADSGSVIDIGGEPNPQFLANTTMETFLQGDSKGVLTPGVSSSCGECHADATMTDGRMTDFTYTLSRVTAP
jgi:hypothetical protein